MKVGGESLTAVVPVSLRLSACVGSSTHRLIKPFSVARLPPRSCHRHLLLSRLRRHRSSVRLNNLDVDLCLLFSFTAAASARTVFSHGRVSRGGPKVIKVGWVKHWRSQLPFLPPALQCHFVYPLSYCRVISRALPGAQPLHWWTTDEAQPQSAALAHFTLVVLLGNPDPREAHSGVINKKEGRITAGIRE